MVRVLCATLVLSCSALTSAHAQVVAPPENGSRRDPVAWERGHCFGGFSGLSYGAPLKLAASVATGFRRESENGGDVCAYLSPKIGMGGALMSIGLARNVGTFGGGVALSGGFLRTFGAPSMADRMSNYAGGSLHILPALAIGLELGYYRRLGGTANVGREHIIAWSLGIGF